ncbi:MAG: CBS domain-containing protein [Chloroflexota bacterium]
MKTVEDILKVKGQNVWAIAPDATVYNALQLMAEKEVGALVVVENERVVGIISERDYARKIILRGRSSVGTPVKDVMTPKVLSVRPDHTVEECLRLMTSIRIRHLPVLANNQLLGMVSIGDLVKEVITTGTITWTSQKQKES